jgi:succinylarginine dihydrolase
LEKIRRLVQAGVPVMIMPPHERPAVSFLRHIGYGGTDAAAIETAARSAPWLLPVIYSSAGMWCANAATVIPAVDASDSRCHVIVANLAANLHRSLEAEFVTRVLDRVMPKDAAFVVHPSLPCHMKFWDEGAANHVRLSSGGSGIHIFVHGRKAHDNIWDRTAEIGSLIGRQTDEASFAVAQLGQLPLDRAIFTQQDQRAIDRGVFHNDVICMSVGATLIVHEWAFHDWRTVRDGLMRRAAATHIDLNIIEVPAADLSVEECVKTYLFNSQLVVLPAGNVLMLCPVACRESSAALAAIDRLQHELRDRSLLAEFVDLDESLANGGGPACLRLRVPVDDGHLAALQPMLVDGSLLDELEATISVRYRDTLTLNDLADPMFAEECKEALDRVAALLGYADVYSFQV